MKLKPIKTENVSDWMTEEFQSYASFGVPDRGLLLFRVNFWGRFKVTLKGDTEVKTLYCGDDIGTAVNVFNGVFS